MTYPMTIGDREYTKSQLLEYGKTHYPKFYWIPRGIGLANMIGGCLTFIIALAGIAYINSLARDYGATPDTTKLQIYLVASIIDMIIGATVFGMSFIKKSDEDYIAHAINRLSKEAAMRNIQNSYNPAPSYDAPKQEEEDDPKLEELKKYKRLLDEGLITQEVYDSKKEEYLKWKKSRYQSLV